MERQVEDLMDLKSRYQSLFMEEVTRRKELERQIYECEALKQKIKELEEKNAFLMKADACNLKKYVSRVSVKDYLETKFVLKIQNKRLLSKPFEYWEPVFDAEQYANYNPDIAQAIGNDAQKLLKHFVVYGMTEGRRAKDTFDVLVYASNNRDIKESYQYDLRAYYLHYLANGKREGRRAY